MWPAPAIAGTPVGMRKRLSGFWVRTAMQHACIGQWLVRLRTGQLRQVLGVLHVANVLRAALRILRGQLPAVLALLD